MSEIEKFRFWQGFMAALMLIGVLVCLR